MVFSETEMQLYCFESYILPIIQKSNNKKIKIKTKLTKKQQKFSFKSDVPSIIKASVFAIIVPKHPIKTVLPGYFGWFNLIYLFFFFK